jgi:hypothetical protein
MGDLEDRFHFGFVVPLRRLKPRHSRLKFCHLFLGPGKVIVRQISDDGLRARRGLGGGLRTRRSLLSSSRDWADGSVAVYRLRS